jgi:hypothetical protein
VTSRETDTTRHRDKTARVGAEKEIADKDDNLVTTETGDNRVQTGTEEDKEDSQAETDNPLEETKVKAQVDTRIIDKVTIIKEGTVGERTLIGIRETTAGSGTGAPALTTYTKETEQIGDKVTTRTEVLVETGILVETEIIIEVENRAETGTRAETGFPAETGTREDEQTRDTQIDFSHKADQTVEAEMVAHLTHGSQKNVTQE